MLQRADRNPNTQGCLDLGLGRDGVDAILAAAARARSRPSSSRAPSFCVWRRRVDAIAKVAFVVVIATHEEPALARPTSSCPPPSWAEVEGTFTNYAAARPARWAAVPAPGDATARWELAAGLPAAARLSARGGHARARCSLSLAKAMPAYGGSRLPGPRRERVGSAPRRARARAEA